MYAKYKSVDGNKGSAKITPLKTRMVASHHCIGLLCSYLKHTNLFLDRHQSTTLVRTKISIWTKEQREEPVNKSKWTFVGCVVVYHTHRRYQEGTQDLLQLLQQPLPLNSRWPEVLTAGQPVGFGWVVLHVWEPAVNNMYCKLKSLPSPYG